MTNKLKDKIDAILASSDSRPSVGEEISADLLSKIAGGSGGSGGDGANMNDFKDGPYSKSWGWPTGG